MNSNTSMYGESLTVEVVTGGFILTYPKIDDHGSTTQCREVFSSPRKLHQKLKEVIESIGLVSEK